MTTPAAQSCPVPIAVLGALTERQPISAYLPEIAGQEVTMSESRQTPPVAAPPPAASPASRSQSVEHTRPRRGLVEKDQFLLAVARLGASDLHLKTGTKPRVRIGGALRTLDLDVLPNDEFEEKLFEFLSPEQQKRLVEEGSVDLAYDVPGSDRFRINVFRQESGLSVAARRVTRNIPSFEALHLPPIIAKIAENEQGLVLLAGVTGSGKSTTIAAMIEHINQTCADHIVTIEDPIEYLFTPKKALINQREIGINVKDFPTALRALVREDPDVVLIGEMRDAETFRAALQAAETGHLVFGTVHASSCAQTIGRVLDLFPDGERHAVRQSFVFNLRAIVAQKLLRSVMPGVSRVPANEVLINTPIVQKLIAEERDTELGDVIRAGEEGMRGLAESLQWLIENDFVDVDTAYIAAPNPAELKMRLKGIRHAVGHVVG
jgi:twitching motility protein PilT